ncbi:MAG: TIGR04283 family arsenosugar biosynthesis glycosyltransferase [Nitrospirota bacterium]
MTTRVSFSIIIPVLNEASIVNNTIRHIHEIAPPDDFEIIVVDGDSGGSTVRCIGDEKVAKLTSPKGRGRQMNKGASVATGDIFLFLHTDTELPGEAFRKIAASVEAGGSAGAFDLGIKSERRIFRLIEHMVDLRTRLARLPYGDQAIFVRRDVFEILGGYSEIPIMEDVEFMRRLKRSGYKIEILPEKVQTSPRRWEEEGVLTCTLRNWTIMTLYLLGRSPEKLVRHYYPDWDGR